MKITITKECKVKYEGRVQSMFPGTALGLDFDRAERMITAGVGVLLFDLDEWGAALDALNSDLRAKDPGNDCFNWVATHRHEVWKAHLDSFKDIDQAFSAKNPGNFVYSVRKSLNTYDKCIQAFNEKNH